MFNLHFFSFINKNGNFSSEYNYKKYFKKPPRITEINKNNNKKKKLSAVHGVTPNKTNFCHPKFFTLWIGTYIKRNAVHDRIMIMVYYSYNDHNNGR